MPPSRFKRSRALWDNALHRPHETKRAAAASFLRAILYELQPYRGSIVGGGSIPPTNHHRQAAAAAATAGGGDGDGGRGNDDVGRDVLLARSSITNFVTATLPRRAERILQWLRGRSRREWTVVGYVLLYYVFVRFMHDVLEAGPAVLIVTALVIIFTVGLGDNDDDNELSAYAVFNRGFQRMLGSVDAEQLLQQHVGGGMAVMNHHHNLGGGGQRQQEERANIAARQEQQQDDGAAEAAAEAAVAPPPQEGEEGLDDEDDENNNDNNDNNHNNNRSRKSGKKARRKTNNSTEQRREVQRQRQAAAAMGFGAGEEEEAMAMQRILEEQINIFDDAAAGAGVDAR